MHRFYEFSAAVLCGLCLFPSTVSAAPTGEPTDVGGNVLVEDVLIVDSALDRLSPSLFRQDFQRLPQPGESTYWINSDPNGPSVSLRPGKILFETSVLWVDPYEVERATPARAAAVAPVLSIMPADRLRTLLREAADAAGTPHGIRYPRLIHAHEVGKAQVAAALKDADSGTATVVQPQPANMYAPYAGPVALSWDDRQVVMSIRIQRYRKVRGKHLTIRDFGPPIDIYYVGASVPQGRAPIDWWTENDGAHLQAELRKGFHHLFDAALGTPEMIGAPQRGAVASVQIGDRTERFNGALIDETDGIAWLVLGKRTLLLVSTSLSQ